MILHKHIHSNIFTQGTGPVSSTQQATKEIPQTMVQVIATSTWVRWQSFPRLSIETCQFPGTELKTEDALLLYQLALIFCIWNVCRNPEEYQSSTLSTQSRRQHWHQLPKLGHHWIDDTLQVETCFTAEKPHIHKSCNPSPNRWGGVVPEDLIRYGYHRTVLNAVKSLTAVLYIFELASETCKEPARGFPRRIQKSYCTTYLDIARKCLGVVVHI